MRSFVRYILCVAIYYTGLASLYRLLLRRKRPIVLTYHRVSRQAVSTGAVSQPGMIVSPSTFERQIDYLREAFEVVALSEIVDRIGKNRLSGTLCSITFDDGWRDVYLNAFPLLKARCIPAVVFLTTGYAGTNRLFWPERVTRALLSASEFDEPAYSALSAIDQGCADEVRAAVTSHETVARLDRRDRLIERMKKLPADNTEEVVLLLESCTATGPDTHAEERHVLDWQEVEEMRRHCISFGSHTVSHAILTRLPPQDARSEVLKSREKLREKLGEEIDLFAYPNGDWNDEIRNMVEEAGFKAAVITATETRKKHVDPFLIPRVTVHEGMSVSPWGKFSRAVFACELSGVLRALRKILGQERGVKR